MASSLKPFPAEDWSEPLRDFMTRELKHLPTDWLVKRRVTLEPPSAKRLAADLKKEKVARLDRSKRAHAIAAQAQDVTTGMFTLLRQRRAVPLKCPATSALMSAANGDLLAVVFYFKTEFNAARPSAYEPDIRPMFAKPDPDFPGHPSYPSGHAAQSRIYALVLAELFPKLRQELIAIADDIAYNREVAGVHFEADSDAGKSLADQVFKLLMDQPAFARLIPLARAEWPECRDLR
ncbi:phosphatase PAP2 family protein [Roseateles asaccharophilus]|uniref:Acid phosphatase (Class A) n=1 Tax=Roseateles asaccharophilus TaxID=582607 RepID=A0ABU2A7G5_9BURK|nr:phosphatase PAP2 family protein [Roseateles asaccharophilus]MDR7332960.1 acid phosphatase (class A) [Roseateles asaccharophilus]